MTNIPDFWKEKVSEEERQGDSKGERIAGGKVKTPGHLAKYVDEEK